MRRMTKSVFGEAFAIFSAAISASAAVQNHRRPSERSLRQLGIDPAQFPAARNL